MDTEFALECQKSKNKGLTPRILVLIVFSCFLFFLNVLDFTMYTVFVFVFFGALFCFVLFFQHGSLQLSRVELYRNDLQGNKNYIELAGSLSYR